MSATELRVYRNFWKGILVQMINDSIMRVNSGSEECWQRQAAWWLRLSNPDFRMVCEYADVCPHKVIRALKKGDSEYLRNTISAWIKNNQKMFVKPMAKTRKKRRKRW